MRLEILQKEMINAMKNKDKVRKDTISSLVQAVKKAGIDNKCKDNIPEELVNKTLLKEEKTMQEMIDTCPSNRKDTLNEYNERLLIIKEFTPTLLDSPVQIKTLVKELDIELVKKNMGAIMKELKTMSVDMKVAKDVVDKMLE